MLSIGYAAGICYNVDTSSKNFYEAEEYVKKRIAAKHESILEHRSLSVEFTIDRGVSHELVRHRLCAFTQSSTRYCDYAGEREDGQCRFIIPPWVNIEPGVYNTLTEGEAQLDDAQMHWYCGIMHCERAYHYLRKNGWKPEQARSVLPNNLANRGLKAELTRELEPS